MSNSVNILKAQTLIIKEHEFILYEIYLSKVHKILPLLPTCPQLIPIHSSERERLPMENQQILEHSLEA